MAGDPQEVQLKLSKLFILVLMGLVLSAVGFYVATGSKTGTEEVIPKMDTAADLSLEKIHYVETKGEKKEWELRARSADHFLQGDVTLLKELTVTFFAEGGRIVTIRGEEGYIKGKKEIEARGNVVITSSDGYRMVTNSLRYDGHRHEIFTSDPVLIERQGMRVKGVGIVVDLTNEKLYIQKDVVTVIEG